MWGILNVFRRENSSFDLGRRSNESGTIHYGYSARSETLQGTPKLLIDSQKFHCFSKVTRNYLQRRGPCLLHDASKRVHPGFADALMDDFYFSEVYSRTVPSSQTSLQKCNSSKQPILTLTDKLFTMAIGQRECGLAVGELCPSLLLEPPSKLSEIPAKLGPSRSRSR